MIEVYIELRNNIPLGQLISNLRTLNVDIEGIQFEEDISVDSDVRAFILTIKSARRRNHLQFIDDIRKIDGIVHVEGL